MTQQTVHRRPAALRRMSVAVGAAYGAQGLGYAVVVTAVPSLQERLGLDATTVSLILLGVCLAAAAGSVLADAVAVWRNSRLAVLAGFALQAVGLVGAAVAPDAAVFIVAIAVYGIGLGAIDAASNMQGVLVQRQWGHPVLGRFYAVYTVGAIAGAIVMTFGIASGSEAVFALLVAAGLQVVYLVVGLRHLDPERAARSVGSRGGRLPRRAIVVVGLVVFAAFTVDSGVSTWSSVHLVDIGTAVALAPIGYAVYQAGVLVARLATDVLQQGLGARRLLVACIGVGVAGCLVVGLIPVYGAALVGFLLAGLAVGALVPVAFGMAGRIDPARSDEIVARVNLFNYGGAHVGAVGIGLVLDPLGPAIAFALPAAGLLLAIPALRSRLSAPSSTATD